MEGVREPSDWLARPARLALHRRLLAYDAWADREALAAVRAAGGSTALRLLAHLAGAGHLWLARLEGRASPLAVWPDLDLDATAGELDRLAELWSRHLDRLGEDPSVPAPLDRTIAYVNSLGEPWSSTVDHVLTHVVLHGSYHRGQIALELAAAGHRPAYTDFIHAVRRGLVE